MCRFPPEPDGAGPNAAAARILSAKKCPLFWGIAPEELGRLLNCLSATRRVYAKEAFIFSAGQAITAVGIVVTGGVRVIQEDFWGNRTILAHIGPGGLFGEAFSCASAAAPPGPEASHARDGVLPVSVVAAQRAEILLIDYRKIITTCPSSCDFHTRLIANMLGVMAQKNIMLTRKMEHISKRTTREKLLSFLSARAAEAGSGAVCIPFNRQELADYLCVNRSALSRELGAMRQEGLLRVNKSRFELVRPPEGGPGPPAL